MKHNYSKAASMAIIAVIYGCAIAVGFITYDKVSASMSEIMALLLADVVATVYVWLMGLVFNNVSVYDPYWSVAPPVMFTVWAFYKSVFSLPVILLLLAIWYWGIRLTGNWVHTFKGLDHEDWRYTRYRTMQSPLVFHLTNFFGLNMMPTLLVFACMLPGFGLYGAEAANVITWLGFAICLSSATVQLVADTQIHRFRENHPGQFCNVGLWKHARHPNYFGEIQMWWGVWVMYASIYGIDRMVFAPLAMTALFSFISIPMMERRQMENKPGYAEYKRHTRPLI